MAFKSVPHGLVRNPLYFLLYRDWLRSLLTTDVLDVGRRVLTSGQAAGRAEENAIDKAPRSVVPLCHTYWSQSDNNRPILLLTIEPIV